MKLWLLVLILLAACSVTQGKSAKQFNMWGYTWKVDRGKVAVKKDQVILTINGLQCIDSQFETVSTFGYGTYTMRFYQETSESGSVAAGYSYSKDSVTEIDVEQQGQYPERWDFTNWNTLENHQESFVTGYDSTEVHTISYVWLPNFIAWYIDGKLVMTHTISIPSEPAAFIFNYWNSNDPTWGGTLFAGTRRMHVTYFSYTESQ